MEIAGSESLASYILPIFFSIFWSVLFLQSGLDKLINWSGNLEWLTGHFSKSFFSSSVSFLLFFLTSSELAAGFFSAVGIVWYVGFKSVLVCQIGSILSCISLLMLFLGQRVAKDYPGAASLVPYFLVAMVNLWVLSH